MTEEVPGGPAPEQSVKRPLLLTVICILSFIWGGMNIISGLAVGTFFDQFVQALTEIAKTYKLPGMEMVTEGTPGFFFISALFNAGSVAGAFMMWKLRKPGFHVYTISQILLIIAPMYFYRMPGPAVIDLVLTGIFVILYSTNLKIMK